MTVGELITALEECPKELTVFRYDSNYDAVVETVSDETNHTGARVVMIK